MKQIILLIFSLFVFGLCYGQDLIVTKSNDSIECKITKVKSKYIYFTYKKNNSYENTLIARTEVNDFLYDIYKDQEIPKDSIPGYEEFPRHLFALNGGYSFDPSGNYGSLPPGFSDHFDELRSGRHFQISYTYFLDKWIGLGFSANFASSSAFSTGIQAIDNSGNIFNDSELDDEIEVTLVAPHFTVRFLNKSQKNALILNTAIGYLSYKNITNLLSEVKTSGSGIGLSSTIGYDIGIIDNLGIGFQIGVVSAMFKTYEIKDEFGTSEIEFDQNERPINAARFDFSVGLRYCL